MKNKSSDFSLKKSAYTPEGPLLLIIMDGVGIYKGEQDGYGGNAFDLAKAKTLKGLMNDAEISTELMAHGTHVGLPSNDDMGNSEVGHNAMGAGRVFDQGAKLVGEAISTGRLFQDKTWVELIGSESKKGHALEKSRPVHFIGLLSDGNVHSHIDHLLAMLEQCKTLGVEKVFIHTLLDGRDVEEVSAHRYIDQLENKLAELDPSRENYLIASGGGRMRITMDRYEADWSMVKRGWVTHVKGAAKKFASAREALEKLRQSNPGVIDQDLPSFVIEKNGSPIGPIQDEDVVIFFNFRGDRAIEISIAFTEKDFTAFDRDPIVDVKYAGMMQYDGDLGIPEKYLVSPPAIDRTVSQYLVGNGISQYAISETQKFGHVTYFWNGNNSEKFSEELEEWKEIPSDNISFDQAPRMKADEITEELTAALRAGKHQFYRVNYANGDMVGHTGKLQPAVEAVEAVDQSIAKLLKVVEEINATVVITADHGNCDQMFEVDKKSGLAKLNSKGQPVAKTSHTLSPVPLIVTGCGAAKFKLNTAFNSENTAGLGNLGSTLLTLLGLKPPQEYLPSVVVEDF